MSEILFGIDRWLSALHRVEGQVGMVTNDAARTARDVQLPSRVALQQAGVKLVRLFSPEHGLAAGAADGTAVADSHDFLTGLPVVSLYGERLRPPPNSLADLDAMLFDIPDIGARFYTYIWTLSHVLEACAEAHVPLIVLDRPNPLGGDLAATEGPILDIEKFGSFVGRAAIPIRHSLTVGELAQLWNAEWRLDADLQVVPCSGWSREMHWPATGLPFVPTSPAIPSYESALLYPGLCLFEATNLSVGRGTDLPFQTVGAPWLDASRLLGEFQSQKLTGVSAEIISFVPAQNTHRGVLCHGLRLRVTNTGSFRPVAAGLHLLAAVIQTHREQFRWERYPSAANPGGQEHFVKLIGQTGIREALEEEPRVAAQCVKQWTAAPGWTTRTSAHLLYV